MIRSSNSFNRLRNSSISLPPDRTRYPTAGLKELLEIADSLGLDCLTEVHNEAELEMALAGDANLIGINNRDLKTFSTDIKTSIKLGGLIPPDKTVVSLSGINNYDDIKLLLQNNINAFLIGESLVRGQVIHRNA